MLSIPCSFYTTLLNARDIKIQNIESALIEAHYLVCSKFINKIQLNKNML